MSKRWYVIKAVSGRESSIKELIHSQLKGRKLDVHVGEMLIPAERITEVKRGKKVSTERKLYPGYIYIEMDLNHDVLDTIKDVDGVTGFLGADPRNPDPLTVKEAELIIKVARSCLAQIGDNVDLAFEGVDPEGVHQMRVGLRRMRALVALSRRALPSARLGRLRGPLRWLSGLLGEVRDLDVLLEQRIDPFVERRSSGVAFEALREEIVALREERRLALREALRSRRHAHLMLELGHWVASLEELDLAGSESVGSLARRADSFAESALARLDRKARKLALPALSGPPAARHDLRIALKKLRYASEFFRSLYGTKDAKRYLRRLSLLQDLLGSQNDIDTAERLLQDLLDRCPPERASEFARVAGFIEGYAVRDQEHALREFSERWLRFEGTRAFWTPK